MSDFMGIIFNTRVARGACCGCKFRRGVGRVSQMSVGILLYTREVGRVYYGLGDVSAYTGIIFNTRVAGGGRGCGVLWGHT